ncbi:Ribosomal protein L25/L23 [Oleidesulfovibrio alaskensis G20]|jgi:large subunit ribosomal protein L23|uniref:Large ribosomal subunit protein uL23 n=1 Tax=Oleidesulfovibrio alaskensis (strain ATCC BAA-1058 / DSM 17464 / G20) TaxID=207559 RepID=RL23_OLEA2|nr:50S ribosomal protein L23 [Oleidesulfovibrio alaskensis]Q30Z44.1 RecName: Full=Large ribosomal subunit protein uL23; AltName: Full=50S ribosomal protein L23 [Oleidesulfovibrio alaskensis G20]ABB39052.1 Ribosomal protein L25/L23 [Oleidesulfovibrio alaskensis G20]MBG0772171.1 50S ribosomal protein L23 [Oleidesulfovibrio alaskensis]MBL3583400.1 50S ribosomal protein L23 [Oleidesulfovibrio alaskensis]
MDYTQILIKPLVSEKATFVKESSEQVVFFVNPRANKIEIKKAVESVFNVKVAGVNVVTRKPQARTKHGRVTGQTAGYKKAYVTLAPGEKIDFFEGV